MGRTSGTPNKKPKNTAQEQHKTAPLCQNKSLSETGKLV